MDLAKFFDGVRDRPFGGKLKQSQIDGCGTLIAAFEKARWPVTYAAYALATAYHETAATMQPIAEYGRGKGRPYGKPDPKTGQTYYGRGYVQLTWLFNYEKAQKELGYPLVAQPDLAMRPDIAADVMVRGMQEGWFTGKANKTYLDKTPPGYFDARRIINGTDKAAMIAAYAKTFELALVAAGYGKPEPIRDIGARIHDQAIEIKSLSPSESANNAARGSDPPPAVIVSDVPLPKPGFWARLATLFTRKSNA